MMINDVFATMPLAAIVLYVVWPVLASGMVALVRCVFKVAASG